MYKFHLDNKHNSDINARGYPLPARRDKQVTCSVHCMSEELPAELHALDLSVKIPEYDKNPSPPYFCTHDLRRARSKGQRLLASVN